MIICSVFGHDKVFDSELPERIRETVYAVLKKHSSVEFWFYVPWEFARLCLMAVMEAKSRFPGKEIIITAIVNDIRSVYEWDVAKRAGFGFPRCMFDRIVEHPFCKDMNEQRFAEGKVVAKTLNIRRNVDKWIMEQSDYVLYYAYAELECSLTYGYSRVFKQKNIEVFDFTVAETKAIMQSWVDKFNEREQLVYKGREQGKTLAELGAELGVTASAVQQIHSHVKRKIRTRAEGLAQKIQRESLPGKTCGIFSMAQESKMAINEFQFVIRFLTRNDNIREIWVEEECWRSEYFNVLKECCYWKAEIKFVLITHYPENYFEENREKRSYFEKMFQEVINVDPQTRVFRAKRLRTIKHIINSVDYCICNLSEAMPLAENIRKHIKTKRGTIVFDVGKRTETGNKAEN